MPPSSASLRALAHMESGTIEALLDAVPDPMIVTDLDGKIVRATSSAATLLGLTVPDLVGRNLRDLLEAEQRDHYIQHRKSFVDSDAQTAPELETRFISNSGTVIPIDASVGKLLVAGSNYLLLVMREVSDRLANQRRLEMMVAIDELTMSISSRLNNPDIDQLDRELEDSIEELGRFCEADAYLFTEGASGTFELYGDNEGASQGGVGSVGLASLPWVRSLVDSPSISQVDTTFHPGNETAPDCEKLREKGITSLVIIPLRPSDRTIGFVAIESARPGRAAWPGRDLSGLIVLQDVFENALERRRISAELRRANRVLQAVSECHDALIRAQDERDLLQDVCRIVVEVGGYAVAWVGYAMDDENKTVKAQATAGEGEYFVDLLDLSWRDKGEANGPAAMAIQTGKPFSVQDTTAVEGITWQLPPYEHGFLSIVTIPMVYEDEVNGVLAVYDRQCGAFDDAGVKVLQRFADDLAYGIAALRARERQREAEDQLRELLRSKDEFIATIAHELRTPLAGVVGFAQVLRDDAEGLDTDDRTEMVKLVAEQGMDLTNIVDDLLVAAKSEAGTLQVAAVRVDLRAQSAQVIEGWGGEIADRVDFVGETAVTTGDPARVRQILRNLISNAVKYGGDHIRVRVGHDDADVYVSVEDDGNGVEAADRDRIFEPYSRAHDAPGLTASMGLGLSISRDLAQLMGGELAYSHESGWSVFTLRMPCAATVD